MERRTRKNMEWLDFRYRQGLADGHYYAHEPVYGVGSPYSEPNHVLRLARTYSIMRRLAQMKFDTLLDVGGGEGYHASLAQQLFSAGVVTSDLSVEANLRAAELYGIPGVASDAHWLPFGTESFDVVLCCEVLEHVADPVAVMCEVMRVARRYALFTTDHVCRFVRERRIRMLLADTESPHGEVNWFLPEDFIAVLGEGVTSERQLSLEQSSAGPRGDEEPGPEEVRSLVQQMTRIDELGAEGHGVLVVKAKKGAPPVDISQGGDGRVLDAVSNFKVEPGRQNRDGEISSFLLDRLACPVCIGALNVKNGSLECSTCEEHYRVERCVPVCHVSEQHGGSERVIASRWPWLTEEGKTTRTMFVAPRPPLSRMLCYVLDMELALTGGLNGQNVPSVDYADSAVLRNALCDAGAIADESMPPPEVWWNRLPATDDELEAMRSLGAAVATMTARRPSLIRVWRRRLGSGLRILRRALRLKRHRFSDVPAGFWARSEIEKLSRLGILSGASEGLYHPDRSISRREVAVWLARALAGGDVNVPPSTEQASFEDVPATDEAHRHVEYVVSRGIVSGYGEGVYRPEQTIDRGHMAIFIARLLAGGDSAITVQHAETTFADVTPDTHDSYRNCHKYVEYLVTRGVLNGYPDGLYHPEITCSRDQAAVMLCRAVALMRQTH